MVNKQGEANMASAANVVELNSKSETQLSMSPSAVRSRARRAAAKVMTDAVPAKAEVAKVEKVAKPKTAKAVAPRKLPSATPIKINAAQKRTIGQFVAAIASGFLPIASFVIAHHEAGADPKLWILVVAALMFSAPSVAGWAQKWCGNKYKAWGFTVLLEGVLVFAHHELLSIGGLLMLVAINAANAWNLAAARTKAVEA
jgi:hypothetical protein